MYLRVLADHKHAPTYHIVEGLNVALLAIQKQHESWPLADFINETSDQVLGLALVAVHNYVTEVPLIVREAAGDPSIKAIKMPDLLRLCGRPVPKTRLRDMGAIWLRAKRAAKVTPIGQVMRPHGY